MKNIFKLSLYASTVLMGLSSYAAAQTPPVVEEAPINITAPVVAPAPEAVAPPAADLTAPIVTAPIVTAPTATVPAEVTPALVPVESNITAAEKALMENMDTLKKIDNKKPSVKETPTPASGAEGKKVTDILSEPADIRPLPEKYLVVKKDHDATDVDAQLMAARTALAQGRIQAALELFNALYTANNQDKRVLVGRAVALHKLGQKEEALAAYELALNQDPQNLEALTNMLGLLKDQDHTVAVEKLQQLRAIYPANAEVTAQLGIVYGAAGDNANAAKFLDMADVLKPNTMNIVYNRAVIYDRMGRTTDAVRLYQQLLMMAKESDAGQAFPLEVIRQRLSTIR